MANIISFDSNAVKEKFLLFSGAESADIVCQVRYWHSEITECS